MKSPMGIFKSIETPSEVYHSPDSDVRAVDQLIRKGKIMKILSVVLLLMACLAFVLMGCSDNPGSLVTPSDQTLATAASPGSLAKGGAIVGSVHGEGFYDVDLSGTNSGFLASVRVEFVALKHSDGTCRGEYVMFYLDADGKVTYRIKGIVKGVKFYGNVAMFYGEVQSEFFVDMFGKQDWRQIFVVTDNDESGAPDRISNPWLTTDGVWPGEFDLFWSYTAEKFLEEMPANIGISQADYPLTKGDVRVGEK